LQPPPWFLRSCTVWKSTSGKNSCHDESQFLFPHTAREGLSDFVCKCVQTRFKMEQYSTHHLTYCATVWTGKTSSGTGKSHFGDGQGPSLFPNTVPKMSSWW
jgi:hypothetical protein